MRARLRDNDRCGACWGAMLVGLALILALMVLA